ncbi:MAG: DUF4348 domain-containing protein [Bacteroidota bacterium]
MKKIIFLLVIAIATLLSCSNNSSKPAANEKVDSLKSSSVKEPADFNTFFKKFKTDSVYQVSHVKFPLSIIMARDEEGDSVSYIEKNKWRNITFKKDKNDIYKQSQLSKTEVTIQHMVEDTGISSFFNFLYSNGKWQLIAFRDQSD